MFTNEFGFDEIITTLMDETAEYEDIHVIITDDKVFIRQWDDDIGIYDVVCMSPRMFFELKESMKHPEGLFKVLLTQDTQINSET